MLYFCEHIMIKMALITYFKCIFIFLLPMINESSTIVNFKNEQ